MIKIIPLPLSSSWTNVDEMFEVIPINSSSSNNVDVADIVSRLVEADLKSLMTTNQWDGLTSLTFGEKALIMDPIRKGILMIK